MAQEKIIIKGVEYIQKNDTTSEMIPDRLYRDNDGSTVRLCEFGRTQFLNSEGNWATTHIAFPLRELLPIKMEKKLEIYPKHYWDYLAEGRHRCAAVSLGDYITQALRAKAIEITEADSSAKIRYEYNGGIWYTGKCVNDCISDRMAERVQLAFIRCSRVEVIV